MTTKKPRGRPRKEAEPGSTKSLPAGPLTEPIQTKTWRPSPPTLMETMVNPKADEQYKARLEAWEVETTPEITDKTFSKMLLLLDHYDIARDDGERWFSLSMKLARDYVPGLQIKDKPPVDRGADKWTDLELVRLYCAFMVVKLEQPDVFDVDIARALQNDKHWKEKMGASTDTLQKMFIKSKKTQLVEMVQTIAKDTEVGEKAYSIWLEGIDNIRN